MDRGLLACLKLKNGSTNMDKYIFCSSYLRGGLAKKCKNPKEKPVN